MLAPKAGLEPASFNQLFKDQLDFMRRTIWSRSNQLSYLGRLPADNPQSAEGILDCAYVSDSYFDSVSV